MGAFANPTWLKVIAWAAALLIASLNGWLLVQTLGAWIG
jgi:manganese transport protein